MAVIATAPSSSDLMTLMSTVMLNLVNHSTVSEGRTSAYTYENKIQGAREASVALDKAAQVRKALPGVGWVLHFPPGNIQIMKTCSYERSSIACALFKLAPA